MRTVAIIGTRGYPSYYGGFETAVRHLVPYLLDKSWRVRVYGRPPRMGGAEKEISTDAIEIIYTQGIDSRSLSTISYGFTATMHVIFHRPDVVLMMNVANGPFIPLLRLLRIPVLINVDGIEWERAKWGRLARTVFRVGAYMSARFASVLIYDSKEIARRWRRKWQVGGAFIPYGASDNLPEPSSTDLQLQPREYALYVARFVPENSVEEFLAAAELITLKYHVVIVGSSGYGGAIERAVMEMASNNDRVHWLGHLRDDNALYSLWRHSGAYFHGHSVGGTNPALVQAMACGAPTVARDTPYNREVLGEAGIFVPPNPLVIAEAVSDLIGDGVRQRRLSESAKLRAATEYTWDLVCGAYEGLLASSVAAR